MQSNEDQHSQKKKNKPTITCIIPLPSTLKTYVQQRVAGGSKRTKSSGNQEQGPGGDF